MVEVPEASQTLLSHLRSQILRQRIEESCFIFGGKHLPEFARRSSKYSEPSKVLRTIFAFRFYPG